MTTEAKKIHEELQKADNILIISHKNPDGDTLSSASALMQYLRCHNKNHLAFCATSLNRNLSFLPHLEYFVTDPQIFQSHRFDVMVILDSGDLLYAGVDRHLSNLSYQPTIINIDHHPTNELYGHLNLVQPEAASTTEILYHFFKINEVRIDKFLATCLLTGIVTDTAHFSNPATSARSLKIAGELLRHGANLQLIQNWTLKNKSLAALKIWGRILSRLQKNDQYNIAYTFLTQADLQENELSNEESEGLANFLNNLGEAKIVILFKDKGDGIIKISLRTSDPETDVSQLAKRFGGGGHAKAAGFSLQGRLEETGEGWQII